MCKNLVEKGEFTAPVLIYNRSIKRAQDLSNRLPAGKTQVVENLADAAAKADVIFTCITNDEVVQEVIGNLVKGDVKGKLFIECSTIHPDATEAVAKSVTDQGAEFVAVPVFGMPTVAEAGNLLAALAGPKAAVDKARPFFKGVMARAEIDFTDEPYRKAATLKVLGNTLISNLVEQLSEAYVVAEKSGLGVEPLKQFVDAMFGGPYTGYSTRMLTGEYWRREEPQFSIDLARKDARHAQSIAQAAGVTMPNIDHAAKQLEKVREHSGPAGDMSGLYGAARVDAGLKFENGDN